MTRFPARSALQPGTAARAPNEKDRDRGSQRARSNFQPTVARANRHSKSKVFADRQRPHGERSRKQSKNDPSWLDAILQTPGGNGSRHGMGKGCWRTATMGSQHGMGDDCGQAYLGRGRVCGL